MHYIYDSARKKQKLTQLLNGDKSDIWQHITSNEFLGLAQGNTYGVKETDTIDFL